MKNPLAPPAVQGVQYSAPFDFVDVPFNYVYSQTLTALQVLTNEVVSIFTEADFEWRGLIITATGSFSVQFQDGQGYFLSSGLMMSSNLTNTPGNPWPVFPGVLYPAGGRIYLNITDTSGEDNVIQLLFVGVNRYRIAGN